MEINTIGRPRNVGWARAAALLYGDWGTSKAYVIGLALAADAGSDWHKDKTASEIFQRVKREAGELQINPLYSVSDSPADTIIELAAMFGVDTVVLSGSRRAALVKLLKGNVVTRVATHLPENIRLLVIG